MLREGAKPKIFLRTLLFCTAERGCVVEGMYVKLHNDGGTYLFDAWGYGETNKLVVGGGLFVPRSGVAFNHHFVLHRSEMEFAFFGGDYRIEVFAKVLGRSEAIMLKEMDVVLEGNQGPTMAQVFDATAFFEWDIEAKRYISSVERRPAPFGPTKSE